MFQPSPERAPGRLPIPNFLLQGQGQGGGGGWDGADGAEGCRCCAYEVCSRAALLTRANPHATACNDAHRSSSAAWKNASANTMDLQAAWEAAGAAPSISIFSRGVAQSRVGKDCTPFPSCWLAAAQRIRSPWGSSRHLNSLCLAQFSSMSSPNRL